MGRRISILFILVITCLLNACAGPHLVASPGANKTSAEFDADDKYCRKLGLSIKGADAKKRDTWAVCMHERGEIIMWEDGRPYAFSKAVQAQDLARITAPWRQYLAYKKAHELAIEQAKEKEKEKEAKEAAMEEAKYAKDDKNSWIESTTGMKFAWIPGGCFEMGSSIPKTMSDLDPEERNLANDIKTAYKKDGDEKDFDLGKLFGSPQPVHKVCVKGFYIGRYEVTKKQYQKLMPGKTNNFDTLHHSYQTASYNDAIRFLRKLSAQSGECMHLPTEAQWEYACRDGGGHNKFCSRAHDHDPIMHTNNFGLHGMDGILYEWTQDCWHKSYQGAPKDGRAWLNADNGDCTKRVIRGGNAKSPFGDLHATNRTGEIYVADNGFRAVMTKYGQSANAITSKECAASLALAQIPKPHYAHNTRHLDQGDLARQNCSQFLDTDMSAFYACRAQNMDYSARVELDQENYKGWSSLEINYAVQTHNTGAITRLCKAWKTGDITYLGITIKASELKLKPGVADNTCKTLKKVIQEGIYRAHIEKQAETKKYAVLRASSTTPLDQTLINLFIRSIEALARNYSNAPGLVAAQGEAVLNQMPVLGPSILSPMVNLYAQLGQIAINHIPDRYRNSRITILRKDRSGQYILVYLSVQPYGPYPDEIDKMTVTNSNGYWTVIGYPITIK